MRVDPTSLKLFLAVTELGTIAAAADREHIAPSAVSKRISDLEDLLSATLLARTNKGIEPTARRCRAAKPVAQHHQRPRSTGRPNSGDRAILAGPLGSRHVHRRDMVEGGRLATDQQLALSASSRRAPAVMSSGCHHDQKCI